MFAKSTSGNNEKKYYVLEINKKIWKQKNQEFKHIKKKTLKRNKKKRKDFRFYSLFLFSNETFPFCKHFTMLNQIIHLFCVLLPFRMLLLNVLYNCTCYRSMY